MIETRRLKNVVIFVQTIIKAIKMIVIKSKMKERKTLKG